MGPENFRQLRSSRIQLFSRIKPRNIFPGEWESIHTGEGIEFAEIRPYEPGDDLRELDLHTLAQSGEEEIIQRVVERQMRIFVWVDISGSMHRFEEMFFARKPDIRDIAIGLLLFSACNTYSPVGLCAFGRKAQRFFPARRGEAHCWRILSWLVDRPCENSREPADMQAAIPFLMERALPQSLVFFVSDFQDTAFEGDFSSLLRPVVNRFDFVPVVIRDPLEKEASLSRSVRITTKNSENRRKKEVYLTPERLMQMQETSARHLQALKQNFRTLGVDHVVLDSPSIKDCHRVLSSFFQGRKRTRG
jgi:uncharacterized protein (DUF58 family)